MPRETARERIENLWNRATPVAPLLDAYRAEVLREAAGVVGTFTGCPCNSALGAADSLRRMARKAP